jgi:inner membrane protein
MASFGHVAIGLSAARVERAGAPSWSAMAAWSALSLLPDADVIGFAFGVDYGDPWGHRGASHSLLFAGVVGALVALATPVRRLSRLRTWWLASAVLASHGLLDTMTDGGLGIALLWPFDLTRYFAPWRPIPVAPIGLAFLSPYGAFVSAIEVILFAPLIFPALRPCARGKRRALKVAALGVWAVLVWLIGSSDPVRQSVVARLVREDTEYAHDFSEARFSAVSTGMSDLDVRRIVGAPLEQSWLYGMGPSGDCRVLEFAQDVVVRWRDFGRCTPPPGVQPGMSGDDVRRVLGAPEGACWGYSRSPGGRLYQARTVCFYGGRVEDIVRRWLPSEPQ